MTPFLNTHELVISTLSPVHVGCGEDYEPTNYVIDGETLHAFDTASLAGRMSAKDREDLLAITREKNGAEAVRRLQGFVYRRRAELLPHASRKVPVAKHVAEQYRARVGQAAQHESGGGRVQNQLAIERTAYNPYDGLSYLPGSSLKGAIRTALLDEVNAERRTEDKKGLQAFQQSVFGYGEFDQDPMRLIKLADAIYQPRENEPASRIVFQVNRKKRPNQFETKGDISTVLECIPEMRGMCFRGRLQTLNVAALGHLDKLPQRRFTVTNVVQACNRFYRQALDREMVHLEGNRYVSRTKTRNVLWLDKMRAMLDPGSSTGKLLAEDKAFLLRVGKHSGAESVTLNGVRDIKIMGAKGAPPMNQPETKTLWLAAEDKSDQETLLPFGWLFVQVKAVA